MAYLSTIVSGVASLGVLLALICGIFFLVLTSLRWVSRVRATLYGEELCRQKRHLLNDSSFTGGGASKIIYTSKETDSVKSVLPDFEGVQYTRIEDAENSENDLEDVKKKLKLDEILTDTVHVREFIEKIVETIIGDPLDGTTVGKLSTHSAYLAMFMKYHGILCRELANLIFSLQQLNFNERAGDVDLENSAQTRLRRLLKKIICEAMALPNIKDLLKPKENGVAPSESFTNKSYEDILATAILNKVVEKFQNQKDTIDGDQRPRPKQRKLKRVEDNEDDSDWSQSSRSDKLSLTIEEYIEEVTTAYEISDDEFPTCESIRRVPFPESGRILRDGGTDEENSDVENESSVTELRTSTGSWEENWLFQKKRVRSTPNAHHPVPVPMLVPNPSEDFRALVGGVDADELSDTSDCTDIMSEDTNSILEENNQISEEKYRALKSDFENNSDVNELHEEEGVRHLELEIKPEEAECKITKTKEVETQNMENEIVDVGEKCVSEENTEIKMNCINEIPSQQDREFSVEHCDFVRHNGGTNSPPSGSDIDLSSEESKVPLIRCRIAEREKEKWKNAVDLPENPYSKKNIEKRAEQNSKDFFRLSTYIRDQVDFPQDLSTNMLNESLENQRFSRDYYINASKHPSGTSSPSSSIHPAEKSEQDFSTKKTKMIATETIKNFNGPEVQKRSSKSRINKSEFCLPNVKELAKQFTGEEANRTNNKSLPYSVADNKLESKHLPNFISNIMTLSEKQEPEIDYSVIPVSKIINNFRLAMQSPPQKKHPKVVLFHPAQPTTQMKIFRCGSSNFSVTTDADKDSNRGQGSKQVHSLTARSISKEFREGLKKNSYHKAYTSTNRSCSGGESDPGEIVATRGDTSPTPSIDLQNMKKFWEELITAHSNATKQK